MTALLESPCRAPVIEAATSAESLVALRPEWERLSSRVPNATPFQSPHWLIPWWRHIGEGRLCTLAARDERGTLIGLLPFYLHAVPDGPRRLFPIGIGTSDYLDALVAPGQEAQVLHAASVWLAEHPATFDQAEWPQLRPGSPLLALPAPAGWTDRVEPAEPCPTLRLPDRFDALDALISRKTLRDLRVVRRRAEEAGGMRWETERAGRLEEQFDALVRLHAMRWEGRGETGVLADAAVQRAHREAQPALLRAGTLRLHVLRSGDMIVAVLYALADPPDRPRRRLYLYLSGFDPALERLSPGMLLLGRAIEAAIAEGIAVLDFLRGQERYKYFWGARDEPTFRRILIPPRANAA